MTKEELRQVGTSSKLHLTLSLFSTLILLYEAILFSTFEGGGGLLL
jgi:hypothetical protein